MTLFIQTCLSKSAQTLSFAAKDVPLEEIFKIIKSQTGVFFFYDATLLGNAKPVTINWKNVSLERALNEVFKDQPITWVLEDKTVTIIKKPALDKKPAAPPGYFIPIAAPL